MPDHKETVVHEKLAAQAPGAARRKLLFVGAALVVGVLILCFLPVDPPDGTTAVKVRTGLAILALAGILWLTEAMPLAVTALLVPVVGVLAGVFDGPPKTIVKEAFADFAHPLIFLFLGGFGIAAALSRQGLNRWIADRVLVATGGHFHRSAVGLFLVAALLSMWISNTATTALLFPVALGMLADLGAVAGKKRAAALAPFLLLGLAYSASVGGIGTLIGTAPNAIAAAQLKISFTGWLKIGLPCVAVLLPSLIVILFVVARPGRVPPIAVSPEPFAFTPPRLLTLAIFLMAVAGWLGSSWLSKQLGIAGNFDSIVAVAALILLAALGLVKWKDIDRTTEWGVLLLFGGGLTLSKILGLTGASKFLAGQLASGTAGWPFFLVVGAVVLFVIFLTELSSNTATTA
ncbi:MAG: DASS family sodium-coupled anion symporter, partial [Akkermansiaceae bacterium]|nr:DASS family sodium-coupled anion symporter [Akkermansiaceae bacterium]